jgi:secretion/DNA translocation related TadE-like protein
VRRGRRRRVGGRVDELHWESGSVSILTAGSLALVMVLTLVSVDLLAALRAKGRAETAADAAALAAAQEIAIPTGASPTEIAADYAELNGASLLSCTCEPGSSEAIAEVRVTAAFLFLGPDRVVSYRARAVIEPGGG